VPITRHGEFWHGEMTEPPGIVAGPLRTAGLELEAARPAVLRTWRVGQVLAALVSRTDGPARAWLRIGGAEVAVRTHAPLAPGQSLTLRVASLRPSVVLEPVAPEGRGAAGPGDAGRLPPPVAAAWRSLLPRQRPLAEALGRAPGTGPRAATAGPVAAGGRATVPPPAAAVPEVRLPSLASLTRPEALAAALAASGLLLEARLARGQPPAPGDLKAALLRAAAGLRAANAYSAPPEPSARGPSRPAAPGGDAPPPPAAGQAPPSDRPGGTEAPPREAAVPRAPAPPVTSDPAPDQGKAVEAALARLVTRQLESLPRTPDEGPRWSVELPVRLDDGRLAAFCLRIDADGEGRGKGGSGIRPWRVRFSLALPDRGTVHGTVLLHGTQVQVRLQAERQDTAAAMARATPRLEAALRAQGLEPARITCRAGRPETDPARLHPPALLDLEA